MVKAIFWQRFLRVVLLLLIISFLGMAVLWGKIYYQAYIRKNTNVDLITQYEAGEIYIEFNGDLSPQEKYQVLKRVGLDIDVATFYPTLRFSLVPQGNGDDERANAAISLIKTWPNVFSAKRGEGNDLWTMYVVFNQKISKNDLYAKIKNLNGDVQYFDSRFGVSIEVPVGREKDYVNKLLPQKEIKRANLKRSGFWLD